ncbi:MAG TPA: hypothetical protein VGQ78_03300 [Vicinamibacteria bacterium]|nr:hypothetical protein [Vicinamibacteria bacterium]
MTVSYRRRAAAVLGLAALLALHFWTRLHASQTLPLRVRPLYAANYETALALLAGKGFGGLDLDQDTRPEAHVVRRFLAMKRDDVPRPLFDRFAAGPIPRPAAPLAFTRVLDMYVAAGVWRLFGIRWSALFAFYAGLSAAVGLLVFFIARRVGGTVAGFLAALLFLASPFETEWAGFSIRDVSPLWFDALGFFVLLCVVDPAARTRRLLAGAWLLGSVSLVGFGWRTDGLLLPVVLLLALLLRMLEARRSWREIAGGLGAFAGGALLVAAGLRALGPRPTLGPQIGFHIAYYGNADRANLFSVEDTFQTIRDDAQSVIDTSFFTRTPLVSGTPEHGAASRRLYLETARYALFRWWEGFPGFYARALGALSAPDALQGVPFDRLEAGRLPWLKPAYRWLLDPLTRSLPVLFGVGAVVLALRSREPATSLLLVGFSVLYAGVWLVILPETKHAGPMLLPLTVVAAAGLAGVLDVMRERTLPRPSRRLAIFAAAALALWVVSGLAACAVSTAARAGYLARIRALAAATGGGAEERIEARRFSATLRPGSAPDPSGYLLTIDAGARPGLLECRYVRGLGVEATRRLYLTRHRLRPSTTQHFFVICFQGGAAGDERTHVCTVTLSGDARLTSVARLDVSTWRGPLVATVLDEGRPSPGPPHLGDGVTSVEYRGVPKSDLEALGPEDDGGAPP